MTSPVATTLKIAADLKRRVVAAAKAADKSPHAFMLEAIEHQTRLDEQRRAFVADAVAARSEALQAATVTPRRMCIVISLLVFAATGRSDRKCESGGSSLLPTRVCRPGATGRFSHQGCTTGCCHSD